MEHPLFSYLDGLTGRFSKIILEDDSSKKIIVSKSTISEDNEFPIIVEMMNGEEVSKKYTFLARKGIVKLEASGRLEDCFEDNPSAYLDALWLSIKESRIVSRE